LVGKLQAKTFQVLAALSGYGEVPGSKSSGHKQVAGPAKKVAAKTKTSARKPASSSETPTDLGKRMNNFGLTVRIEINLPADGDQETYDRIFKSIRENLLNE